MTEDASPIPAIETARLRLRGWRPADLEPYAAIQADPEFRRYVGHGSPLSIEESRAAIAGFEDEWRRLDHGRWAVEERTSGVLIGACGILSWQEGTPEATAEIAFGFGRAWWGRGYATEAARAAVEWAFDNFGFPEMVALTNPDNVASQRVLAKLGFAPAGETAGPFGPMALFRLTRTRFEALSAASD